MDDFPIETLDSALVVLPLLPSLRALDLSSSSADTLFGSHVDKRVDVDDLTPEHTLRWEAFGRISSRITKLKLESFRVDQIGTVLAPFVNLRSLVVVDLDGLGQSESIIGVCPPLARNPQRRRQDPRCRRRRRLFPPNEPPAAS